MVLLAFPLALFDWLLKGKIDQRTMVKETNTPTSIQQPPPLPPQKNIKNAILVEVACEIKEAINEAVEKNDANTGSLRKIMYSVENKILNKHQASNP